MKMALWNTAVFLCAVLICAGCRRDDKPAADSRQHAADSAAFYYYINAGNVVYAEKEGYNSFSAGMKYYDSAQDIAYRSHDTLYLAEALFAKGRVYDAWNKDPEKTIRYLQEAAQLFQQVQGYYERSLYVRHLVAHAYDKVKDSVHATAVLRGMYAELAEKDTGFRARLQFIPEMALIATEVNAYTLADSILRYLVQRADIANHKDTYDYLSHYYLTRSRMDVLWQQKKQSPYLDSLQQVYDHSRNLMDKLYYGRSLAVLYDSSGDYRRSARLYTFFSKLSDSLNNNSEIKEMQETLLQSELNAEKHKLQYNERIRIVRANVLWLLSALLAIITILSIYLYRRNKNYRQQSLNLLQVNEALDNKVEQVALLNKEIQHRIKNNLQMIYSLLQMQERKTDNEETIAALQAARLRVESIAALHNQLLHGSTDPDLAVFIKELVSMAVNCLSESRKVVTHIVAGQVQLPSNNYFALSLILNEWVTNSVKYATAGDELLEIHVTVQQHKDHVRIVYHDNHVPAGSVPAEPGLGTRIIQLLVRQLNGELVQVNNHPYHYMLYIPYGT